MKTPKPIKNLKKWRTQFWSDWKEIRTNPNHRFKNDLFFSQLKYIFQNKKVGAVPVKRNAPRKKIKRGFKFINKPKSGLGGLHYTEASRQQDGNLFLSKYGKFNQGEKIALFLGASYGLTAMKFLRTLPARTQSSWRVISSDYCPPDIILRSYFGIDSREKRKEIITQIKDEGIEYQVYDLMKLKLKKSRYDFIDVCNCLDLIHSMNQRMDSASHIWSALKVGGYLRTTTPNFESKVRQAIFKKTGNSPSDYEVGYLSLTGKTYSSFSNSWSDPKKSFHLARSLTRDILKIRKVGPSKLNISEYTSNLPSSLPIKNATEVFILDLLALSPVGFMAGFPEISKHGVSWSSEGFDHFVKLFMRSLKEAKKSLKIN